METYAILKPCERQDDGVQYNCAWGLAGGVKPQILWTALGHSQIRSEGPVRWDEVG